MQQNVGGSLLTQLDYVPNTFELSAVTTPLGGKLRWEYGTYTYASVRQQREVTRRYLRTSPGATELTFTVAHESTAPLANVAASTTLDDPSGGQKVWTFKTDAGLGQGLLLSLEERVTPNSSTGARRSDFTWSADAAGNTYLSSVLVTQDYGTTNQVQRKNAQVLDEYGNVLQSSVYGYGQLTTPVRTYAHTYLTAAGYTSSSIFDRLLSTTLAGVTTPLVSNTYDQYALTNRTGLQEHDTAAYGTAFTYRGNLTTTTQPGSTLHHYYDITGTPTRSEDDYNHFVTLQPAAGTNNAAPGRLAARDEDAKAVALTYSQSLGLSTETGPNGDTGTVTYDSYGRVASRKSPHGATTTYSYDYPNRQVTATTGARWVRTTSDGLGRTVRVENGMVENRTETTVSTVDTEYAPCACSPLGKVKRVSQPYAPGGAVYWTTYTYDGLGRTTSVTLPDGSVTTYAYAGNTVTVTDPAGKWKKYTRDAMGNLTQVTEPDPAEGTVNTDYTYDLLNHLTQVSMRRRTMVFPPTYTTQTRSFTYDAATQRLASATNPENGAISYVYNSDGTLNRTTDAQAQRTQYTYDLFGRVIQIDRYRADGTQDPCQSVTYTYDSNLVQDAWVSVNPRGRLTGVKWGDPNGTCPGSVQFEEQYTYTTGGLVEHKRLQLTQAANTGYLDAYYTYDTEGRPVTHNLTTPVWNSQIPTTLVSYGYGLDALGRPASMERAYGNNPRQTIVSNVQWGAAGELKQMDYGVGLPYRETRTYNARLQMTNAATTVNGTPLTNLTYTFPAAPSNNGRVSQVTDSISGLVDETVTYQYDALNRLSQAAGSGWSWAYAYDGFGNRTQQGSSNWDYDAPTNRLRGAGWAYDANGNLTADPLGRQYSYDVANRLVSAGGETYVYDSQNRRICKNSCTALTFYGAGGERLGTFQPNITYNVITFQLLTETIHFAGKLIQSDNQWVATDRLGSVRADSGNGRYRYYPYGEEYATTTQNRTKYATYYRDSTGLDYADQRCYTSTTGRFLTPDPGPADLASPATLNRYAYVVGDPVNFVDPTGMNLAELVPGEGGGGGGGGNVFVIPGLIFSVWKWLFGGSPNNPMVDAWKNNPGAQVAAWDRKIADALEEGESQVKRFLKALKVVGDCYQKHALSGTMIRRFEYQPIDQNNEPFARGEVTISEQIVVVQGGSIVGGGVWDPSRQNASGSFYDYVGKQNPGADDVVQYQTFSGTILNPNNFMPGVPHAVMVFYPGYGGGYFGTMGHWMTNGGVRTNNYWYPPAQSQAQLCPDRQVYP